MAASSSEVSRIRHRIDRGHTGDKVNWPDPAAAPLGTDDEAGSPVPMAQASETECSTISEEARSEPKKGEGPIPNTGISRFNDGYGSLMTWGGLAVLLGGFLLFEILG